MAKTAMIRARVEPGLKHLAEGVLSEIGLTPTTAITLLYRSIVMQRGLPIDLHIPNAETRRAMRDARAGRGLIKADSLDELLKKLDAPERKPRRRKARAKR